MLDARTNLPPKQAADLHPGRAADRKTERVSARELFQGDSAAKREGERTHRSSTAMQSPPKRSSKPQALSQTSKKPLTIPGLFFVLIAIAIFSGGMIGLAIAAAAIIYAGYSALKSTISQDQQ